MIHNTIKTVTALSIFILAGLLLPATAQICTPVAPDLVSWFSGDNNALDSRSRNNGTLQNGATFGAGQVGQAFNFDGINDSVQIPHNATLNINGDFTAEAWIFPRTLPNIAPRIFDKDTGAGGGFWQLSVANEGATLNALGFSSGAVFLATPNNSIALNQWNHVAVTVSASSGIKLYVNGIELASTPQTTSTSNNAPLIIGNDFTVARAFDGLIDESAIYNRTLTAPEIASIANAGSSGKCKPTATVAPSGQTGWWAGDGDARDIAGTNDGTLEGGAGFAVGKVGQSFNLDGTNDSVRLPLTQTFQNFTLEAWVKPLSAVNDPINQELILGQAGFGEQMVVLPGTNGGMRVKVSYRDTINSFAQVTSTTDIPLNDWSHLAATFDGTTLKLFINGVLNNQLNPTNTAVLTCSTPYFIGGFQTVTDCNNITNQPFQFFNGLIDEASVYNHALTDAEIASIVNSGVAGKLKQNRSIDTNSLVSLWRGENNANDTRGTNNGAFAANSFTPGRVGQAFQTNGGRITVPDSSSLDFTNAYTIEMWFAPAAAGTAGGFSFLACKGDCGFANNQPYSMGFLDDRKVYLTVGNNSTIDRVISNSPLPLNSFSHIAGTYDGTTMRIYINGILDATKTTAIGTLVNSSNPFVFGGSDQFGNTPGIYDEVALYNRALTAAEVRANYESGNALSTVGGDARVTFPSVTTAGTTQQIPLETSDFPALTMGMHTGLIYDIDTSATFAGNPTVCFNLPLFTPAQFSNLRVMHFENNNWIDVTAASNTFPALCTVPVASFSPFAIAAITPTAAEVSVSGRVLSARKRGIAQARVSMTDLSGNVRTVFTNSFGYYRFDEVPAGAAYIFQVKSKFYRFANNPIMQFVGEDLNDFDFTALP